MTKILSGCLSLDVVEIGDDTLAEIAWILNKRCNFSISPYKDTCMKRRITMRMRSSGSPNAAAYCSLLRKNEQELELLKKALTIHVSQFFRNPSMFEKLRMAIVPTLLHKASQEQIIFRVWSLGCASGEEPYSIGILLQHYFSSELSSHQVDIHACDVDAAILEVAARAEYAGDRLKDLSDIIRERYFAQRNACMQLVANIREMVTFHNLDIMSFTATEPCLLVLCRNTLIYFNRQDQEKILLRIANILLPGGILVLGKTETLVGTVRLLFSAIDPVERIYRRL